MTDIPWYTLTKTFQDAIYVTRYLGYQYLWIDSLCIMQDDPNDWANQAPLMGQIYGSCTLAIFAVEGSEGDSGLFSWRKSPSLLREQAESSHLEESALNDSEDPLNIPDPLIPDVSEVSLPPLQLDRMWCLMDSSNDVKNLSEALQRRHDRLAAQETRRNRRSSVLPASLSWNRLPLKARLGRSTSCTELRKSPKPDRQTQQIPHQIVTYGLLYDGKPFRLFARRVLDHDVFKQDLVGSNAELRAKGYPLMTRGWVLQERMLAPRAVYFTPTELVWKCRTRSCCECEEPGPSGLHGGVGWLDAPTSWVQANHGAAMNPPEIGASPLYPWQLVVQHFSRLDLTFETDCLPALSGVAHEVASLHNLQPADYLAGLWRQRLPIDLLWQRAVMGHDIDTRRPSNWLAPSWSWASVRGPVDFFKVPLGWPNEYLEVHAGTILEAECILSSPNMFGAVSTGQIKLRAPVLRARIESVIDISHWEGGSRNRDSSRPACYGAKARIGNMIVNFSLDIGHVPEVRAKDEVICLLVRATIWRKNRPLNSSPPDEDIEASKEEFTNLFINPVSEKPEDATEIPVEDVLLLKRSHFKTDTWQRVGVTAFGVSFEDSAEVVEKEQREAELNNLDLPYETFYSRKEKLDKERDRRKEEFWAGFRAKEQEVITLV